jgi:hypothetical protein
VSRSVDRPLFLLAAAARGESVEMQKQKAEQ